MGIFINVVHSVLNKLAFVGASLHFYLFMSSTCLNTLNSSNISLCLLLVHSYASIQVMYKMYFACFVVMLRNK